MYTKGILLIEMERSDGKEVGYYFLLTLDGVKMGCVTTHSTNREISCTLLHLLRYWVEHPNQEISDVRPVCPKNFPNSEYM